MRREFQWTAKRIKAAQLLGEGVLSDEKIAAECGITRMQIWRWRKSPEFQARVNEIAAELAAVIRKRGIASAVNRIKALNDRWDRMTRVIEARAVDMKGEIAGGDTGLMVRQIKISGQQSCYEYAVDTGLLRELREHEKQAAQELGQWAEKHQVSGPDGGPIQVERADLSNLTDADLEQLEAIARRALEPRSDQGGTGEAGA